jgi:hypothetical protein
VCVPLVLVTGIAPLQALVRMVALVFAAPLMLAIVLIVNVMQAWVAGIASKFKY